MGFKDTYKSRASIETVVLERDAVDAYDETKISRGKKALRIILWKGSFNQTTFYSLKTAKLLKEQFDKAMEELENIEKESNAKRTGKIKISK